MQALKLFIDIRNGGRPTFPAGLSPQQFEMFYRQYDDACYAEGVIPLRAHVGYEDGRVHCFTMAPDKEAVKRAHARVGLPFDSISEVSTAAPADRFFRRKSAS